MAVLAAMLAALLGSLCLGDVALCSVHFVLGHMFCLRCCLYEADSADPGCRYLWALGLSKDVKSLFEEHAGCDLVFLMVIFVYVGYLIHLDGC